MSLNSLTTRYSGVYMDPPWKYRGLTVSSKTTTMPQDHYPCMSMQELKSLDVPTILLPDALVFMWSTSAFMSEAIDLGRHWGLRYSSMPFVWVKDGRGVCGPWTMQYCEFVLLFRQGKRPQPKGSTKERQLLISQRGRHSEKPDEIRDRVARIIGPHPKLEMFARKKTSGWDVWGNEV